MVIAALVVIQLGIIAAWRWKSVQERPAQLAVGEVISSRAAPPLSLERSDGSTVELATLAGGRPVLVHFWATWCPPCREELPHLLALGREAPDVVVVAVAVDDDWGAIRSLVGRRASETYRSVRTQEVAAWGSRELPDTWLVNTEQEVVRRWQGPQDWAAKSASETVRRTLSETRR